MKRIYRDEKIYIRNMQKEPLVLHSDNGGPMKGTTMLETLYALGITPSKRGLRKSERKTSGKMGKRNQSLEFFRRRMAKSKTRSRNKKRGESLVKLKERKIG